MRGGDEDTAVSRPIARASPSPLGAQRSPAGGAHISTGRLRSTQNLAHLGQSQITATGTGLAVAQLQWHGAAGSPRSSGCLSGSSGGNRAAFGLIITLSVLSCTRGDIPGPANTLWNLGVVLGAIPSAKTRRVLSLKAISTLLSESYCFGGQEATTIFSTDAPFACTTAHSSSFVTSPCFG